MQNLIMIAAVGKNRELGKDNKLIWRIKEDLDFFRKTTNGHFIAMGRKTLQSLPKRLENRRYIIISTAPKNSCDISADLYFQNIPAFLKFAERTAENIYVIGGASVYAQLLPHVHRIVLTEIEASALADTFFPTFNKTAFTAETISENTENGIRYKRIIYTKK